MSSVTIYEETFDNNVIVHPRAKLGYDVRRGIFRDGKEDWFFNGPLERYDVS